MYVSERFPYSLPIFRRFHEAISPDGTMRAWMEATEISMSNPTIGELQLSNGLRLQKCNPAFIWSDDSRFLAVPQWRFPFGLQLRQRILVLEPRQARGFMSPPLGWFLEPSTFTHGRLVVTVEPTRPAPRRVSYSLPQDLQVFKRFSLKTSGTQ